MTIEQKQIEILVKALKFYADKKNCDNPEGCFIYMIDKDGDEISDEGYTARKAFEKIQILLGVRYE